jgi:glycerol-3-phosphate acyltransferase PlsY
VIPLLLSVSALLAYFLGCVDTAPIACEKFLKRDLRSFGRGKSSLEALYRETGIKGVAAVYVPEVLKIAVAVIAGGLLLSIKGHAAAGRMLALFCLLMGTAYPATRSFRGRRCILALCVGALCVDPKAGLFVLIVFAGVLALTRYVSLSCVCAAAAGVLGVWVFIEEPICVELSLLCMLVIVARHGGHLVKTFKHTEPKLSTKKDLSYKFDEDF